MDGYKRDLTQQLRGMGLSVSARPDQRNTGLTAAFPGTSLHLVAQTLRLTAQDRQATMIYNLKCEMCQDSGGQNVICVTCYI